jgi:ribosomal protein S18 acetylase RimI-like enzyme
MLARAFYDDPPQRWLFPDDHKRIDRGTQLFELLSGIEMGQQAWIAGDMLGGAVWFEPGGWPIGAVAAARRAPLLLKLMGRRAPIAMVGLAQVEGKHPSEPHWYLPNIGVAPEHRGQGLGSALLAELLQHSDESGDPAYLDAATDGNAGFFERHGFRTVSEMKVTFGPRLLLMRRDARRRGRVRRG